MDRTMTTLARGTAKALRSAVRSDDTAPDCGFSDDGARTGEGANDLRKIDWIIRRTERVLADLRAEREAMLRGVEAKAMAGEDPAPLERILYDVYTAPALGESQIEPYESDFAG